MSFYQYRLLLRFFHVSKLFRYLITLRDFVFYRRRKPFQPLKLYIEVSSVCGFRCPTCFNSVIRRPGIMMNFDRYKEIVDSARPVYLELTSMGESFYNKELSEMVNYAKQKRIYTKLITNGFNLDEKKARALVNTGIDYLIFSLDSLVEEVYDRVRSKGKLPGVIENIKCFQKLRDEHSPDTKVGVYFLISALNIDSFSRTLELAEELNFDKIWVGLAYKLFETPNEIFILEEQDSETRQRYIDAMKAARAFAHKSGRNDVVSAIDYCLDIMIDHWSNRKSESRKLCYSCLYNPYILADGTLLPCCLSGMAAVTDKNIADLMSMGNVFDSGFMDSWQSEKAARVRRSILEDRSNFAICRDCDYEEGKLFGVFNRLSHLIYRSGKSNKA